MKFIAILFVLVLFSSTSNSFADQCGGPAEISDPEAFIWTDKGGHFSGTMEIAEANLVIGGETITTRVYRQAGGCDSIPGPTIKMVPGNKYVLKFRNVLPYEVPEAAHNVLKDPNVSNLHTHGLHISGETPGDDVTRSFEGSAGGDFVYDIPSDHMGGTFWYHAHHHGSTFLQVSGGAFGLIIIDDSADGIPESVAFMTERQLVIGYLDPDVAGTGGDTLISGTLSPTWTVNGNVNGDLIMPPDTWQHFRILLADRDAIPKTVSIGSQCEVALLARDGVWRTVAPLVLANNSIKLTGASRADLAVKCSADSSISVGSLQVASIVIDTEAAPDIGPSPYNNGSTWSAIRPSHLRDLRGETVDNTETVNMGASTINGFSYDHDMPTFELQADGLQRWSLEGASNHPFHLHIYHIQIDGSCADYEDGEYYDVVADNCNILFDLDEVSSNVYQGRTIMHCHILKHEDQGAMGWMKVLGGMGPPTFPSGFGYVNYVGPIIPNGNPPAAPDGLIVTAASSSQIDLFWNDSSTDEAVFDIERSLDGANFGFLDFVGADITTFSDTGLTAGTTYYYRISATNGTGSSAHSNIASDTTLSGGTGTSVQVDSVTITSVLAGISRKTSRGRIIGRNRKTGRATVVIRDDVGTLVADATVYGQFDGDIGGPEVSATTDQSGSVTFDTATTFRRHINLTFCVNSVEHDLLTDYSGIAVCGSLRSHQPGIPVFE